MNASEYFANISWDSICLVDGLASASLVNIHSIN